MGSTLLYAVGLLVLYHCVSFADGEIEGLRRPSSLAISHDSKWLYVGNRDSGTVATINTRTHKVDEEIRVGASVTDLVLVDDGNPLLMVIDAKENQLHCLAKVASDLHQAEPDQDSDARSYHWRIASTVPTPPGPSSITYDAVSSMCYVACKWGRSVGVFRGGDGVPEFVKEIPLEFEAKDTFLLSDARKLVVTSAFDGKLGVVDLDRQECVATRQLEGHNMGQAALDWRRKELLFPMQTLNPHAQSTFNDIHWGNLISNQIQVIPVTALSNGVTSDNPSSSSGYSVQLGRPDRGTGDPSVVIRLAPTIFAVLIASRGEVHFWKRTVNNGGGEFVGMVPVGERPIAATIGSRKLYVANQLSDSISVIDIDAQTAVEEIPLSSSSFVLSHSQKGEQLFYNSQLSLEGWMSCHSCHTEGHTNGMLNDNLSDGGTGSPKRVLSLLGAHETQPWTWTGNVDSLEQQVVNSITVTMQGTQPSEDQVGELVAFMKTLNPSHSKTPGPKETELAEQRRGQTLFRELDCQRCHQPPTYTSPATYDVGMMDESGNAKFNPPSLRGVKRRTLLFHDGRAKGLRDVFEKHHHQVDRKLTQDELQSLVAFLKSL